MPSGRTRATGGGIWVQGGTAGDGTNLFVTTGNTFGAEFSGWTGEAIIRLRPGLAHSNDTHDFFTPSNWKDLDNSDEVISAARKPCRSTSKCRENPSA